LRILLAGHTTKLARQAPAARLLEYVAECDRISEPLDSRDAVLPVNAHGALKQVSGAGLQEAARERAVQALAKAQNIPVEQARTQVAQYEQQYRQVVDQAKRQATAAADATATAVSRGALFGAIALLFGALAAWFGGRMGALDPSERSAMLRRRQLN
jgi:hypothetical protein